MVQSRADEIEEFKTQINLCEYASSHGYVVDQKLSSRGSVTMRHAGGDKLVISRGANRHWKYFNVHDDRDRGTIIDFIQVRGGSTIGEVRKVLREWSGGSNTNAQAPSSFIELVPSEHDLTEVLIAWDKASYINGLQDFLQTERKISSSILSNLIFAGRIKKDTRQNALFAHYNNSGVCGYEIKNRGFTGFSPGGIKGLFCSRPQKSDNQLIICETAIDALSYATLFGTENKRFLSTAGQISPLQKSLLQSAAKKMPTGSTIVLAMDNDKGGQKLTESIKEAIESMNLDEKQIVVHVPDKEGADWNDVLRGHKSCRDAFPVPPTLSHLS